MNPVRDKKVKYCYVYVMSNPKGRWYTGFTNNLRKRFNQHVAGKSTYTKHRGPWDSYILKDVMTKMMQGRENYFLNPGWGNVILKTD